MDLLSSTLGAVGAVGEGIDKFTGGRAVRGALAGKPRELASVLPFSDSLGITNHGDLTSGRDLTDRYGITDKNDHGWGSSAAGFVADNMLSPANWLGAGAAFKAAPSVARGLGGAAKALSGADLLDHVAGGASRLGGFLGGESGAARLPPLPIDADKLKATSLAANVSRPRRFSTDPARAGWYQGDRTARFGRRFGGGPGNTAVPGGIPEFHLGDAIRRFGQDESGALDSEAIGQAAHLLYSKMGMTPPHVYHFGEHMGDAARGLASRTIEKFGGAPEAASEVNHIASRYLDSASADANSILGGTTDHWGPDFTRAARSQQNVYQSRLIDPLTHLLGRDPSEELGEPILDAVGKMYDDAQHVAPKPDDYSRWAAEAAGQLPGDKLLRYKVADDLANNAPGELQSRLEDLSGRHDKAREFLGMTPIDAKQKLRIHGEGSLVQNEMGELVRHLRAAPEPGDPRSIDEFLRAAFELENRVRGMRFPDVYEYPRTGAKAHFGNPTRDAFSTSMGEINASDTDLLRVALAPKYIDSRTQGAVADAAHQFAGHGGGALPKNEARDLATRFFRAPEIPKDESGVGLADQFAGTLRQGRDAASAYFSPLYWYINKHLRDLGPEGAPREIDAIRRGRADELAKALNVPQSGQAAEAADEFSLHPPGPAAHDPDDALFGEYLNQPDLDNESIFGGDQINTSGWDKGLASGPETPSPAPGEPFSFSPGGQQHPLDPTGHPAPAFAPDGAKIKSFQEAFGGADPYELMGDVPSNNWQFAMNSHFGDEAPQYKKFFEDMAKKDGTWTGLEGQPATFTPDKNLIDKFHEFTGTDPITYGAKKSVAKYQEQMKAAFSDQWKDYDQYFSANPSVFSPGAPPLAGQSTLSPEKLSEVRPVIAGLMGMLEHSALPHDMNLHRGIDAKGRSIVEQILGAKLDSPEAIGKEFVDPAFISTAFDPKTADAFAGLTSGYNRPDAGVTFDFGNVPAGRRASFMNASENEVLFPPGRRVKITDNSNFPRLKAELYGTLLAALMGGRAMNGGQGDGNPGRQL